MRVIGDRIIAKIIPIEEKTKGGLILSGEAADQMNEHVRKAVVVVSNLPEVKPGETVAYNRITGSLFKRDGEEHIVLDRKTILFVE